MKAGQQEPFPSSLHPERRHHRDERRAALFLLSEQRTDHARPERDIGIEQQSERRLDPPPTLLKSPQLAGPSIRKRSAAADFENQRGRCSLLRDLSRVVAGAVVDQDNPQAPPLMSKRRDRVANDCRLVTGRNEDRHVFETALCRIALGLRLKPLPHTPGLPWKHEDAEPNGGACRSEAAPEHRHAVHR